MNGPRQASSLFARHPTFFCRGGIWACGSLRANPPTWWASPRKPSFFYKIQKKNLVFFIFLCQLRRVSPLFARQYAFSLFFKFFFSFRQASPLLTPSARQNGPTHQPTGGTGCNMEPVLKNGASRPGLPSLGPTQTRHNPLSSESARRRGSNLWLLNRDDIKMVH